MPHLRFNISKSIIQDEKTEFAEWVINLYAEIMETTEDHIGVIIQTCEPGDLHIGIGRIDEPDRGVMFLNMDIRKGRPLEQKRKLITSIMEEIEQRWGIPVKNMHVALTEHDGEDFNFYEGTMKTWSSQEP